MNIICDKVIQQCFVSNQTIVWPTATIAMNVGVQTNKLSILELVIRVTPTAGGKRYLTGCGA